MNFVTVIDDGNYLNDPQPLKMGGVNGLLAKHIQTLESEYLKVRWQLTGNEIAQKTNREKHNSTLFVNTGSENVCYILECVIGVSSSDMTDLVLRMSARKYSKQKTGWQLSDKTAAKQSFCESLLLTGGYEGGQWRWQEPAMSIGAAII